MIRYFLQGGMKFLLFFLFLAQSLFAYHSAPSLSIYFPSGGATLKASDKKSLDSILDLAKLYPQYELQLWAYTDDQGSEASNTSLAAKRAQAVEAYLKKKDAKPKALELHPVGALALYANWDTEEQRKRNRRVDILFIPLIPKDKESLFAFFRQKALQNYTIDPKKTQIIQGLQGGRIIFPAMSLVDAVGRPAQGLVSVTIIEAYSLRDMIYNNLQTIDIEGKPLQSGGMIYIEARDSKGQKLKLAASQEIELSLPAPPPMRIDEGKNLQTRLAEDMLLFSADRAVDASTEAIQWLARGNSFQQTNSAQELGIDRFDSRISLPNLDALLITNFDLSFPYLPPALYREEPPCPKARIFFQNQGPKQYSYEELSRKYQKKFFEGRRRYRKRIDEKLQNIERATAKIEALNQARQDSLQEQEQRYMACLGGYVEYDKNRPQRQAAFDSFLTVWGGLSTQLERYNSRIQYSLRLFPSKNTIESELRKYEALRLRYIDSLAKREGNVLLRGEPEKLRKELQAIRFLVEDKEHRYFQEYLRSLAKAQEILREDSLQRDSALLLNYKMAFSKLALFRGGEFTDANYADFYALYEQLLEFPEALAQLNERIRKALEQMSPEAKNYILDLQKGFQLLSRSYELLKMNEQAYLRSRAQSSGLGWINCDRFLNMPDSEKWDLEFAQTVEEAEQTAWFVVFPEYNSIMSMQYQPLQERVLATRIPRDAETHLIGLRNIPGEGLFIHHKTGKGIRFWVNREPNFEIADLQAFDELLGSLTKN